MIQKKGLEVYSVCILKCIKCDAKAEYLCFLLGTGGSFCKEHLVEFQTDLPKGLKQNLDLETEDKKGPVDEE